MSLIRGVNALINAQLVKAGIRRVSKFLQATATVEKRESLSGQLDIDEDLLETLWDRANMYRIRGLGPTFSYSRFISSTSRRLVPCFPSMTLRAYKI